MIGLSDRVGSSMGHSEWLLLMTRWMWLWCHRISARGAAVTYPCVVGIEYIIRALTGSFSLDTAPVTGSLLLYTPVCCLAVCCAAGFSLWVLFGSCDCVWLAVLFSRRVSVNCVMKTDSDAAAGAGLASRLMSRWMFPGTLRRQL